MFNGQFNYNLPQYNACYGCEERKLGCHSGCKRYEEFKNGIELRRKQRNDYIRAEMDISIARKHKEKH